MRYIILWSCDCFVWVLASRDRAGRGSDRRAGLALHDVTVSGDRRRRQDVDGRQRVERQRYVIDVWASESRDSHYCCMQLVKQFRIIRHYVTDFIA